MSLEYQLLQQVGPFCALIMSPKPLRFEQLPRSAPSHPHAHCRHGLPFRCCPVPVFDVTRRETLSSLSGSWMEELQSYDPHPEVARMVVANKVDQVRQEQ